MFIDQNGISQLLPTVAHDLNAADTMSWAGTAALIGNTTFQVLYGRLSDIFGRKKVYLSALALLSFADLMCGVARNAPMFYVFRGLAGVAGGGITSLSMMIVSDIVTLERRGKFQGILGSMVGGYLLRQGMLRTADELCRNWQSHRAIVGRDLCTEGILAIFILYTGAIVSNLLLYLWILSAEHHAQRRVQAEFKED